MFDFLKRESANVATVEPPPQSVQERLAAALADFQEADEGLTEAAARFVSYLREHRDRPPLVFENGKMRWRIGAMGSDLEREKLELEVSHALGRRNETLHRWSQLKVGSEGGQQWIYF